MVLSRHPGKGLQLCRLQVHNTAGKIVNSDLINLCVYKEY